MFWKRWKTKPYRKVIIIAVALLLVGGMVLSATVGLADLFAGKKQVDDVPGDTVAVVNGVEIGREDFEAQFERAKDYFLMQGVDLEGKDAVPMLQQVQMQMLQQMINNVLLLQQAEEEGLTPTDEEVQSRYDEILGLYENKESLEEQLSLSALTLDDLRQEIAENMAIEKYLDRYIEENVAEEELAATEEELEILYEQYSLQNEDLPAYEEMKPQLQEALKNEKLQSRLALLIEELYGKSEIEILL